MLFFFGDFESYYLNLTLVYKWDYVPFNTHLDVGKKILPNCQVEPTENNVEC